MEVMGVILQVVLEMEGMEEIVVLGMADMGVMEVMGGLAVEMAVMGAIVNDKSHI